MSIHRGYSPPRWPRGSRSTPEGVLDTLKERGLSVFPVNAFDIAQEVGELRAANMVLVGALSSFVSVKPEHFIDVINKRVKKGFETVNVEAFKRGRALTGG